MPTTLSIYINGKKVLEYDKNIRHPGKQRQYLDGMDLDMDKCIKLNDEIIASPDKTQRANYVAMSLLYGIENKNEGMISNTCGYLVNRLPELKEIRAMEDNEEITLDLIFYEVN